MSTDAFSQADRPATHQQASRIQHVRKFLDRLTLAWEELHRLASNRFISTSEFAKMATDAVTVHRAACMSGGCRRDGEQATAPGPTGSLEPRCREAIRSSIVFQLLEQQRRHRGHQRRCARGRGQRAASGEANAGMSSEMQIAASTETTSLAGGDQQASGPWSGGSTAVISDGVLASYEPERRGCHEVEPGCRRGNRPEHWPGEFRLHPAGDAHLRQQHRLDAQRDLFGARAGVHRRPDHRRRLRPVGHLRRR
jgi:hypothetical protein